ncbi:MAG: hypothetical protein Q9Q40_04630 [Acidobacteriota bacterium]|nr:hypothetical protein [Acidobacteriota bacterium]
MSLLCLLFALATGPAAGSSSVAAGQWTPAPTEATTLLLLSGSDRGYIEPKKCWGRLGGSRYRAELARWLDDTKPGIERLWLGTGNVVATDEDGGSVEPEVMLEHLDSLGYSAIGIGPVELQQVGPFRLLDLSRQLAVPLLATNLRIHETGESPFHEAVLLDTRAGRLLVMAVLPHDPSRAWFRPDRGTVVTVDPWAAVEDVLTRRGEEADFVLLLSTLRQFEVRDLLARAQGIDLMAASDGLLGRFHPVTENGIPVQWLGGFGHILGRAFLAPPGELVATDAVQVRGAFPIDPITGRRVDRIP